MFNYQNNYIPDQKRPLALICILLSIIFAVVAGCGKKEPVIIIAEFELEVNVTLQSKPLPGAVVFINNDQVGLTDEHGYLSKVFRQKPGKTMHVRISKAIRGCQIEPWLKTFIVQQPQSEILDKYAFNVDLQAEQMISVVVTDDNGIPLADANVRIDEQQAFKTNADGLHQHRFIATGSSELSLNVSKAGYTIWNKHIPEVEPGQSIKVVLARRSILSVAAFTDRYGISHAIRGVDVLIDGRRVGRTDRDGIYRHTITGMTGTRLKVTLHAAGYIPSRWNTIYKPGSDATLRKHFRPNRIKPLKIAHIGYRNNGGGNETEPFLKQLHAAVERDLYRYSIFKKVPVRHFRQAMASAGLNRQSVLATGWHTTAMLDTVDMIVTGSVSRMGNEWLVITEVVRPDGKIILSTLMRAMGVEQLKRFAKGIARSLMDRFPFEGIIAASQAGQYRINLSRSRYRIRRGNMFKVIAAEFDSAGKISSYRVMGRFRVYQADETGTWARIVGQMADGAPVVGQRVVRQVNPEKARVQDKALILKVSRGRSKKAGPLGNVQVYLSDQWVGQTGSDGKTKIFLKPGQKKILSLYKHGFEPLTVEFEAGQSNRSAAFSLEKVSS